MATIAFQQLVVIVLSQNCNFVAIIIIRIEIIGIVVTVLYKAAVGVLIAAIACVALSLVIKTTSSWCHKHQVVSSSISQASSYNG